MEFIDAIMFGFIPFLISTIIIYNLLNKTKIFGGDKAGKKVSAIIAVTISMYIFLGFLENASMILKTFLILPLLVLLIFVSFVTYKTLVGMKIHEPKKNREKILFFIVVLLLIIFLSLYIFTKL